LSRRAYGHPLAEIFHLDESGYVLYSDVEIPPVEEEAQLAVDSCPEQAISRQRELVSGAAARLYQIAQ
jgi:hypothetical protein